MFIKNPVETDKGIFRKDIYNRWWRLEKRSLGKTPLSSPIPMERVFQKIADMCKGLENPSLAQDHSTDKKEMLVIGWGLVSNKNEIREIEESVNSGRIIRSSSLDQFQFAT